MPGRIYEGKFGEVLQIIRLKFSSRMHEWNAKKFNRWLKKP